MAHFLAGRPQGPLHQDLGGPQLVELSGELEEGPHCGVLLPGLLEVLADPVQVPLHRALPLGDPRVLLFDALHSLVHPLIAGHADEGEGGEGGAKEQDSLHGVSVDAERGGRGWSKRNAISLRPDPYRSTEALRLKRAAELSTTIHSAIPDR